MAGGSWDCGDWGIIILRSQFDCQGIISVQAGTSTWNQQGTYDFHRWPFSLM